MGQPIGYYASNDEPVLAKIEEEYGSYLENLNELEKAILVQKIGASIAQNLVEEQQARPEFLNVAISRLSEIGLGDRVGLAESILDNFGC